jgi:DNA polymerase-3 subunit epsilon
MYAIIDTETTGLSLKNDRIIELAVIGLDADGNREWEWCSLINPERDTGHGFAVRVHQIYSRDVADAPTFSDFAGHIANILRGRAVIAHNAIFDLGMLGAEFGRIGVKIPTLTHLCTMDMAKNCGLRPWRLENCCTMLGIELEGAHHALADARATWCLAQKLFDFSHKDLRKKIFNRLRSELPWPKLQIIRQKAVTRPILPCRKSNDKVDSSKCDYGNSKQLLVGKNSIPVIESFSMDRDRPEAKYLAAVEWVLEDRHISQEQKQTLSDFQAELKLTGNQVREIHLNFIRGLAGSMWSDGVFTEHEKYDLNVCGKALQLTAEDILYALQNPIDLDLSNEDYRLEPGERVVFTGEMSIPRSDWIARAKAVGLRVTGAVSGKTGFLIVPFGETGSTKTRKARELGVRVISEQRFIRMISRLELSI